MTFAQDDLTDDAFLGGALQLWQPRRGYRAATDPVLLAASVPAMAGQSVLDLGCGAGAAVLCLAVRVPGLRLAGVEVQPAYADLARRNATRAGLTLDLLEADIAVPPRPLPLLLQDRYDHVISNPPYFPADGSCSPDVGRAIALNIQTPIARFVELAARRLAPGGHFTSIFATACLPEVLAHLGDLGSVTVLPLAARSGRAPARMILQARKGGRAAFRMLAPLILHRGERHDADGDSHSTAAAAVLRTTGALVAYFK